MSKQQKKLIRLKFREAVFSRDNFKCRMCGDPNSETHDAHHITDRTLIANGGFVPENGITLCPTCHEKAESYHMGLKAASEPDGYSPAELYSVIGSSVELAFSKAQNLQ